MLGLAKPLADREAALAVAIDHTMRAKLPHLPHPLVAAWDERQRLVISRGEPWIVGPIEVDPYLTKSGGYPFPDGVADQLRQISEGGALFHRIAIAHEVDAKGPVAALLPRLGRFGLPITETDAKAYLGKLPVAAKPKDLAAAMDRAIKKTMGAAGSVTSVLAAPMLDPIVFGVVGIARRPTSREPAIYYPLAAWVW